MIALLPLFIMWSGAFSQSINDVYDGGVEKMKKKIYDEAIKDFSFVIQKDSYYYNALHDRAMCYAAQNKIDLAIKDLSASITAKKDFLQAFLDRADIYYKTNKTKEALADYEQIIKLHHGEFQK